MPKASFVMPVKNGEKFIEKTIKSLINQTEKDIEIIVVNDHSEDNTSAILEKIAENDTRLKIINQSEKKHGVAAARNTGSMASTGDFIFPVDGDDPNFPRRVEISLTEITKNNADLFYGNAERYYIETDEKILRHFQNFDPIMIRYINTVPHGASAFKREIYKSVGGYDESLEIGEDYDFFLSALDKGYNFCSKNIAVYQYTMHAGQVTSSLDPEKLKKRQEWNKLIRAKHNIFEIDTDYVKNHANPEVADFYVNKNFAIWFAPESIPIRPTHSDIC